MVDDITEQDGGSSTQEIITKLLDGDDDLFISNSFINKYNTSNVYRDLPDKDKKKVNKIVKQLKKESTGTNKFNLKCPNCLFHEELKPGTMLYKNNYIFEGDNEIEDLTHMVNDPRLLHFNNYVCKNDKCETHKDGNLKDAVLIPDRIKQITIFICTVCETQVVL